MEEIKPYLALLAMPVIMLALLPLARKSGAVKGQLIRGLESDIKGGSRRGYAIIAIVVAIIVLAQATRA